MVRGADGLSKQASEAFSRAEQGLQALREVLAATARREKHWKSIPDSEKPLYVAAVAKQWKAWLDNDGVEIISPVEARSIRARLKLNDMLDRILQMRHVLTDKNDGKRTDSNPLPVNANDRIVVPGYKDPDLLDHRRDAPTASRH